MDFSNDCNIPGYDSAQQNEKRNWDNLCFSPYPYPPFDF